MLPKDTKLLRLVSARLDMSRSLEAYAILRTLEPSDALFYHAAVSMAVSYGRPFFESTGVGTLFVEYPKFPDFPDADMNLRHHRMLDLRNKFMAHSSCEGTKVMLLPPGSKNPIDGSLVDRYDHLVGKRSFGDIRFYDWLKDAPFELKSRLDAAVRKRLMEIGSHLKAPEEMETGYDDFKWTPSKA